MLSITATLGLLATTALVQGLPETLEKRYTTVQNVQHTFYGYPDNDPPSAQIAYDCGRGYTAGGSGTYDDPRTMATAPGEFAKCEIVWDPYTEKYLRFEDTCAQCISDCKCSWKNGHYHIDIWTGSSTQSGGQAQINCEDRLTPDRGHDVVRYGNQNHEVNTGPLYSPSSGCHPENVYPNAN
ncbi:uncharacterized protein MYCFIDRAFT_39450 [Pseudocercospora fijiensis CIRAD86]|uniref:Uncharacterized protein n=1 Tax=Pseudocercospora fijiensis (strain CIRAD86) TaxID=383855 RepID=M3A4F3_PSEFD|nr:uncharacterized protein MYCFIDRAFT_39450 [Pseudocercospora fijiensis CIRAD86]EME85999.1 hypothetical protein MYCFIDRAFT_39450 [Pseudocercospora fijiensis CIRAD86]